jgi:hypothetical protein
MPAQIIDLLDSSVPLDVDDMVELWVQYSGATVNLHSRMFGVRNGKIGEIFELQG